MKIGNWEINDKGIQCIKHGLSHILIDKNDLTESGFAERKNSYDWLLHLPSKADLTREDIYALNTAFIYAIEYFNLDFNSNSFIETLTIQEKELNNDIEPFIDNKLFEVE